MKYDHDFWSAIDTLVSSGKIVIDRPKGSTHPRFPHIRYDVDYGYIENTTSMDGDGIDVWKGSLSSVNVNAIICTVDLLKRDSEIKLLIGCTEDEMKTVCDFHNDSELMKGILIRSPSVTSNTGTFSGEVIDLGEGKARDYEGKDVKGKFVVVHLTPRSYSDGSEQRSRETTALKNGAKGILMVGQPLSNLPARWPSGPDFMVMKVSEKAAKTLLTQKQLEATVSIDVNTEHTFNVVAKIEAPEENNPEGDVLILGAHYDHMGLEEFEGEPAIFAGPHPSPINL